VILAALVGVGVLFACALAWIAQQADAQPAVASCDHPGCSRLATVKLDVNGRKCYSCESHVGEIVREASDSSFEAFGVAA